MGTATSSVISCIFLCIEEITMSPRGSCITQWHVGIPANTLTKAGPFSALVRILLSLMVFSQDTKISTFQGFRLCSAPMHLKIAKERYTSWYFPLDWATWDGPSWRRATLADKEKDAEVSCSGQRQDSTTQRKKCYLCGEASFCSQAFELSLSLCVLLNPLLQGSGVMQRVELKPGLIGE